MRCPTCRRELDAARAPGGDPMLLPNGHFGHILVSRCPYPSCSAQVFGVAERGELRELVDRRNVTRRYRSRAFVDVIESLVGSLIAFVFVGGPLAAMRAAFLHPTRGVGSMLVVLGGTLLIIPASLFFVFGTVALVQQWRTTRRAFAKVLAGAVGGLRLAPSPKAYRAH